ncbi:CLIP-associating protein isoform X2 [Culicoides brevitarsis]|uniref:CLIP-associating protein isoform X2 n=1 Tax=Culicoides brevitarsis TaxID=469753 RepID=UPI00307B3981
MAYHKPIDLDGFIELMGKTDMRVRAQLADDLVAYLQDGDNSIECLDLGSLIDGLVLWMNGSHFKIAQRALESYIEIIGRLEHDFIAYVSTVLPHVIDRLGDNKDTVREKAQALLQKLLECKVLTPQTLVDKLSVNCFKHKNAKVREEFLTTIVSTLNEYGTQSLVVKAYIPPIVLLLGDPHVSVRECALQTLVDIYKHVGDKLRADLKKRDVPPAKMATLEQKFDEARNDGLLLPSAFTANTFGSDDVDNATMPRPTKLVKRTVSATPRKFGGGGDATPSNLEAGAVSAEIFEASFEQVPVINIFTQRDMDDQMKQINTIVGDKTQHWEKRVEALKKLRTMLMMNVQTNPNFPQQLKDLSISFLDILKELRSQVIREACITLAYMSKVLKNKLDQFCIYILQELINLIQNSAKIISSAGLISLEYIIRYTHAPKLVPIVTQNLMQSKSKDIRSALSKILILLFEEWPTRALEKNQTILRDALKKGIADADSDARRYSRIAFWGFRRHFPDLADQLFGNLDPSTQRSVDKERDGGGSSGAVSMSASLRGSNTSLNSMPGGVLKRRTSSGLRSPAATQPSVAPASTSTSTENLAGRFSRIPTLPRNYNRFRSGIPVMHRDSSNIRAGFRSVSAVDTAAAQRARARAQYSNMSRLKVSSGAASLPRAKKLAASSATPTQASPERQVRTSRVSQSQPTSRSTSPSSRLHSVHSVYSAYRQTGAIPKKTSGIPRSLANSRETSPTRNYGSLRRNVYGTGATPQRRNERPPMNPGRPVLAQKMLQASREAENALADALSPQDEHDMSSDFSRLGIHRKQSRDESDESEASSVCSERSFDSYRRGGEPYSWNGSRSRLDSSRVVIEDIEVIIQYCASSHWSERKDGLISLTDYLSQGQILNSQQLQCILDLFRKMFMDPHVKVYALFLDTVNELILAHSQDLHDWLFILLTRLFNKLGTDLLASMLSKIWKTLQLVYEYFPADLQMSCVFRILADNVQTPNVKTKHATVKFLSDLAQKYCKPEQFVSSPPADKAMVKIIQYAIDPKSMELRGTARLCIVHLYNCNTAAMTILLSGLPKQSQDTAKNIISSSIRRSTSGTNSPSSPLSCSSPKPVLSPSSISGPFSLKNHPSPRSSRQTSVEADSINTEEVYKHLRKTTAEIQNYSFENKLDRDANSKDSGISQMGDHGHNENNLFSLPTNGYNGHFGLDTGDSCNGSKTQSATTTESNTPENTVRMDGMDGTRQQPKKHNFTIGDNGELVLTDKNLKESEIVKTAITLKVEDDAEFIVQSLSNLAVCIKYGNGEVPSKNFKALLKMILSLIESNNSLIVIAALQTLSKILRSTEMQQSWSNFLELIVLKYIDNYKTSKEVQREIDLMIPRLARVLPLEPTVAILNPVIATGEYPCNLCALKLLTEIVDTQGQDMNEGQLDLLMPNIARLTEDQQSMVRKAAVFCIVKLYVKMGEDKVKPKLQLLNSSKIRLLNVYIQKALSGTKSTS